MKITVGSICSGIEAASVALESLGYSFEWFSEIADFPSKLLKEKYPSVPNLGDMNLISKKILDKEISAPDFICGGTPCQAFSLAGLQNGLNDDRGNLALRFVDIIECNDKIRLMQNKKRSIVFWENVEGVLSDKTNAFGCLISSLAGLDNVVKKNKWPTAGVLRGPKRNVAWRVIDAKYFGIPQQRRRLYLLAGDKDFFPENILFEENKSKKTVYPKGELVFQKEGHKIEIFREYTDCLYAAYGTKWNGNAAAYNGSLFVVQDDRIRRLTPLETERLMGFPDDYTNINGARNTLRYQGTGNSWAVPVIKWIGERIKFHLNDKNTILELDSTTIRFEENYAESSLFSFGREYNNSSYSLVNTTAIPENCVFGNMQNIIDVNAQESLYISPVGCYGIIRRKNERNIKINPRLEEVLLSISSQMNIVEIEKKSNVQKRGKFSIETEAK